MDYSGEAAAGNWRLGLLLTWVWDGAKQWEFARRCELAPGPQVWQEFLDRIAHTWQRLCRHMSPPSERSAVGTGEEDKTGEQRWWHSKLSCFISLIWVKRGKLKNPQKSNKSALLPLSRYAAQWAVVGGLPWRRWDAADPSPRLPLQLSLHRKMQLINLCVPGEGCEGHRQKGLGQSRHVGTASLSSRSSDLQDWLEPTPSSGFPLRLAPASCKAGLNACMHTLPRAWVHLSMGPLVHVGCWGCPLKPCELRGCDCWAQDNTVIARVFPGWVW